MFGFSRKKRERERQEEESDITMEEFQQVVGRMMRASQEANWEKKRKKENKPETPKLA